MFNISSISTQSTGQGKIVNRDEQILRTRSEILLNKTGGIAVRRTESSRHLCPSECIWHRLETFLLSQLGADTTGFEWVEARDAVILQFKGQPPTMKNYLAANVSRANVERPDLEGKLWF